MELEIRDARPDDAEAIVGILNPIIAAGVFTVFDTPFTCDFEREYIRRFPTRGVFVVAVKPTDQQVVGFQNMEPFASYTHAFDHVGVLGTYVNLNCRRQGIATQLFRTTLPLAVRKGYEKIFTFVRADNPAALRAYLRQGFQPSERRSAKLASAASTSTKSSSRNSWQGQTGPSPKKLHC